MGVLCAAFCLIKHSSLSATALIPSALPHCVLWCAVLSCTALECCRSYEQLREQVHATGDFTSLLLQFGFWRCAPPAAYRFAPLLVLIVILLLRTCLNCVAHLSAHLYR